ncbi:hypothetical protein [Devosia aurantiaca]|uniref:HNH endonuclease n=1 Tax=Devosia aurantiaca TaxID=2714858 RepID=A0A6M1SQL5_9HYPH|nr:hypothetical protein [Devosia aurantiaca]NGP19450.1 hypothetical protein [Devosia aurantiaca]
MRIRIRRKFRAIAEQCKNEWVVLYQSSRGSDASDPSKGYFATAIVIDVDDDPEIEGKCLVQIARYDQLTPAQRMMTRSFPKETALLSSNHRLKGWKAAEDVRVISDSDYAMLTGREDASSSELNPIVIPRFRYDLDSVRDPKFSEAVYRAYDGRCAISGVSLLYRDGSCGLQAAHIYPFCQNCLQSCPRWHLARSFLA